MRPNNVLVIFEFMVTKLGLSGTKLLVYAVIYGFSQAEGQYCTVSLEYYSGWTGTPVSDVKATIAELLRDGLIKQVQDVASFTTGYTAVV